MLKPEDIFKHRTEFEKKLCVVGASSDLAQLLDSLLTDSQREQVTAAIDSWYSQQKQAELLQAICRRLAD